MSVICLQCNVEMRTSAIGSAIIEWAFTPEAPYCIYWVDEIECPACHIRTTHGHGNKTYHHEAGFESALERARASTESKCYEVHERRVTNVKIS